MAVSIEAGIDESLREEVRPLVGDREDFDSLLALVGESRLVLLGGGSHGTHEFHRIRSEITKRLIREKGFSAIAVEGDWPDAYRVNRFVQDRGSDTSAAQALSGFKRFPQWMWRNADVLEFVGWLRDHNDAKPIPRKVGFYGLDLYSLTASMEAVLSYLRTVDPEASRRARKRYSCFGQFGGTPQSYACGVTFGLAPSCEKEVIAQLVELQQSAARLAAQDGRRATEDLFFAEQNARIVLSAERYYRAMFGNPSASWNLRGRHMAAALDDLMAFLEFDRRQPKVVVWAHNSHLGDARATEIADRRDVNLGQLARERWGDSAVLVGFNTNSGTVTAASDWDEPAERKIVHPAVEGSYEALFHELGLGNFFLNLRESNSAMLSLGKARLERAIGVVYRSSAEQMSHYLRARLPYQFDAIFHYDVTRAVEPIERTGLWERGELPDTYPSAF